jgi:hypothetical protein
MIEKTDRTIDRAYECSARSACEPAMATAGERTDCHQASIRPASAGMMTDQGAAKPSPGLDVSRRHRRQDWNSCLDGGGEGVAPGQKILAANGFKPVTAPDAR